MSAITTQARTVTGNALQGALVDLIDLSLLAKQAHWSVRGRNFRSVHLHLDELVDLAREHLDTVAERAITIGAPPDGRALTVAKTSPLPQLDAGYLPDDMVTTAFAGILADIITRFRTRIAETEETDPVTQDLFIAITHDLEKQHWMFDSQQ